MPPIPGDWIAQDGIAIALLAIVALMVFLGWLIPLRVYRQLERDRDTWRQVALKAMGHTDALIPAAQVATEITQAFSDATTPVGDGRAS